ncbi:hypothetical protein LCGC14_0678700 [marine sediment metagenome]|uniref:Uncharacterized protein n=1 Tax=marine sediment metagenome TaxID=412755 RepID=A0A0F9QNW9_9ZZZZ
MAQLSTVYAEENTTQTHTGDLNWLTALTVPGASFEDSTNYLMLVRAQVTGNNTSQLFGWRTQIGGVTPKGALHIQEPASSLPTRRYSYIFLHKFTTAATAEDVTFDIQNFTDATKIVLADTITVFAINLDELTETDWYYGEDTTTEDHPTISTWQDQASITFTPGNASDDWLILAGGGVIVNNTTKEWRYRINFDSDTEIVPDLAQEGEDTAELISWMLARPYTLSTAEHTFTVQSNDDSDVGDENQHDISKIFALRLNAFKEHAVFWSEVEIPGTLGFSEIADMVFTPTDTGNGVLIGSAEFGTAKFGPVTIRTQVDDISVPEGNDGAFIADSFDNSDILFTPALARFPTTADVEADVDVDAAVFQVPEHTIVYRGFASWSLELVSVGGFTGTGDGTLDALIGVAFGTHGQIGIGTGDIDAIIGSASGNIGVTGVITDSEIIRFNLKMAQNPSYIQKVNQSPKSNLMIRKNLSFEREIGRNNSFNLEL